MITPDALRAVPLFAALEDAKLQQIATAADVRLTAESIF